MKFNVGDEVQILNAYVDSDKIGEIRRVVHVDSGDIYLEGCRKPWSRYNADKYLRLINKQTIMSSLKDKFSLIFKNEPEKSFRKAGITDSSDSLTSEGRDLFLAYLLKKHGDDFKKEVVDPILAEEENK